MNLRTLGQSTLNVAPICLGGNVFGWTADQTASFAVLDAYVARGGNFIDTADVYSRWAPGHQGGESETVLGNWMRARNNRSQIVLATKVGMDLGDDRKGLSRRWITRAVEDSLRRLQTDYIDLYQAHADDPHTPLEETLGAFDALVRSGKVRSIGASNYNAARLAEALQVSEQHGFAAYVSLQPKYNLVDRAEFEAELEPLCHARSIGVIGYSSIGGGFLSGKYKADGPMPTSARAGSVQQRYMNAHGFAVLAAVEQVAAKHGATPTQVALAWLLTRPAVTAPIVSGTTAAQVDELCGAMDVQLDAEDLVALDVK